MGSKQKCFNVEFKDRQLLISGVGGWAFFEVGKDSLFLNTDRP